MKKDDRGSYDYRSDESGLVVVRWNDNSVVTVASNAIGVKPVAQAKR